MKIAENEILGCFRVLLGPVGNVCSLSPRLYKAVCEKQELGGVAVGTVVALKVLPMHGDARNEFAQLRERVASLCNLSHRGIEKYHGCFPVYDIFGDRLVLVSEWLEGEPLKDCLLRNPQGVDADEVLRIGAQLLSALTYLSSRGIVHRDIKPTNIFLSKDGGVKLVGLDESSLDLKREVDEDACPVGTFDYMAPDFLDPGFHGDVQSDIFSLGVCLHEMLSGQLPYRNEVIGIKTFDRRERLRQRMECADPIQIDKRIGESLIGAVEVLEKALRTNREERYLTFADFASSYKGIRRRETAERQDIRLEKRVDSSMAESGENQSADLFMGEDADKLIHETYDSDDNRGAFPIVDYAAFDRAWFVVFEKDGKKGMVERHSGTVVVNPVFEDIKVSYDCRGKLIDNVINVKDQGQWRLYRLGYGYPIAPQFVYLGRQREGVCHALYRGKLHGFVDAYQRIVLPFAFADAKSFSEGVCAVKWNPRDDYDVNFGWGYVDHAGNCVIRGHYLDACEFRRGFACVQEPDMSLGRILTMRNLDTRSAARLGRYLDGMRWGIIDSSGRTIMPCTSALDEVHSELHRLRQQIPAFYKLQEYVPSKDNIAIPR